ncbi:hypothetical protein P7C70_g4784, partial [Phenoliferia sp. Uapishka_3]
MKANGTAELEASLQLRAIAVIQRDARRASGQPPLLPPSPEAPAPPPSDIASTSTLPGQVPIPDSTENDMDEDNVNDSLFGDSVVASPVAGAVAEGVDGPGNALEGMTFELAQVMAPGEQTALPGSAPPPVSDLSSLLAMVDDSSGAPSALPLPLPFPLPATDFALPPPPIGMGMDFQLPPPPLGTDFNQFNPYAAFDPTLGSTGTTGLAGGGAVDLSNFDYGSMGDIGQMPSEADLEELMKSLGGANGAGTT